MNRSQRATVFSVTVLLVAVAAAPATAGWRNGTRFDPGVERSERAPGAPEQLDRVADAIGQYDVEVTRFPADGEPVVSKGLAEITFINRGHALMESFYSEDLGGGPFSSVLFLGYNPGTERWFLAGSDSHALDAWVADGGFEEAGLVLSDTERRNGGILRTEIRYTYPPTDDGSPHLVLEESTDGGARWTKIEERRYTRRPPQDDFLAPASRFGEPHPDRPAEAAAFDFLIGEWTSSHEMTFPNGQRAQWQANDTGVYVLDGHAVLEFNWFDVDPSLPDAATTILRIYNPNMRRWENLYLPNRGHSVLYFGGVEEDDRIVLTGFEVDAAAPSMSRFVFHDIREDEYSWYAESSTDRGDNWTKTWKIAIERKPSPDELAARSPELSTEERAAAIEALEEAQRVFDELVVDVGADDWHRKPAPEKWSVGEVAEHILLSEKLLYDFIQQALAGEAADDWAARTEGKMERIQTFLPNRSIRAQAPGPLVPTGEVGRDDCLRELSAARAATLAFTRDIERPIKAFLHPHPAAFFGDLNVHQWLHFIAAHHQRHNQQIAEAKEMLASGEPVAEGGP